MNDKRFTVAEIEDLIVKEDYVKLGEKTTVCIITTVYGMEFIGSVHCQNVEDYDMELGKIHSRRKAVDSSFSCGIIYLKSKGVDNE